MEVRQAADAGRLPQVPPPDWREETQIRFPIWEAGSSLYAESVAPRAPWEGMDREITGIGSRWLKGEIWRRGSWGELEGKYEG